MQPSEPYFQPPNSGPRCSTPRSARLRQLRFDMGLEQRTVPPAYVELSRQAKAIYLEREGDDPAVAKACALRHVAEHCPVEIDPDTVLLGGENPFLFFALWDILQSEGKVAEVFRQRHGAAERLRGAGIFGGPNVVGHHTPGLDRILRLGVRGLRDRVEAARRNLVAADPAYHRKGRWYEAALISCDSLTTYARRYREAALRLGASAADSASAAQLREAGRILALVPEHPAATLHQALQSYWMAYILATVDMGGLYGGGCGLGRPDQYLYPYYQRDVQEKRLDRAGALELLEIFLLCFRHEDYFTPHQIYTPGSQASLGGVTPAGDDAANELSELFMEASLRIAMPAPYLSVRLHRNASPRYWQAAAHYVLGGLGFPVVNDETIVPAFVRHGRPVEDARDYICACCYEHTIPGRELNHPSGIFLNLPAALELALADGCSLLSGQRLGLATGDPDSFRDMDAVWTAFCCQTRHILQQIVELTDLVEAAHARWWRYPLMSLFVDDCIDRGLDFGEGGARYNPFGLVVNGIPNLVNALAAIEHCVFDDRSLNLVDLTAALRTDFAQAEGIRRHLLAAPKWGNDDPRVDRWAGRVAEMLYAEMAPRRNARGGPWQLALYSFDANLAFGRALGASADGRRARQPLTRNMDPTWGTDRRGPTAVLKSLANVDWSMFPDGSALNLRFAPQPFLSPEGRATFADFLKGFVALGVMQMQITMVDTATLLDARAHPESYPHLMVKVAGYSARFTDLSEIEQEEIIQRTAQVV